MGFPSTTTAKRGVSPTLTSRSSIMDSNVGATGKRVTHGERMRARTVKRSQTKVMLINIIAFLKNNTLLQHNKMAI